MRVWPGQCGRLRSGQIAHQGAKAAGMAVDRSPVESKGRLAVAWVEGVLRGGVMVVSSYIWHSEGLTERNSALLDAAGATVAEFGGPWIIGADWNMTPAELSSGAGDWL